MDVRAGVVLVAMTVAGLAAPSLAAPRGARAPGVDVPPNAAYVTAHYLTALARLKRPQSVSFEYSLAQLGLHTMEQTHRVYRSGRNERDEMLVIDGVTLKAPAVRVITGHNPHYDIAVVTPRMDSYRFIPIGARRASGGGFTYIFHLAPHAPRAFTITAIELDGRTFLPSLVKFTTAANGARGSGMLRYSAVDGYWVVREAAIAATLPNGKSAREHITWSKYRFPITLPRDTFRVPHSAPTPLVPNLALPAPIDPAQSIPLPGAIAPK